jgi:alkylhydroperoxidase family enzyme
MTLLNTISPEKADGEIAERYEKFIKTAGTVPKPFEMLSVSPNILKIQGQLIDYFMNHPNLGFPLLAHIRYLVAKAYDYSFCINFNSQLLMFAGLDENQIKTISEDPSQASLEEKDKQLLLFVLKSIKTPEAVTQDDVDTLRDLGWTDTDIFDAVAHGTNMIGASIMMKAFKIE